MSRRHVYLQILEKESFWIDLDSRSGTFSDGQLRKFGWLEPGKIIRVGPFDLQQLSRASSTEEDQGSRTESRISPLVARSHGTQPLPEVALEFLNGPSRAASWPMNRVMSLIGSASGCKFRLADPSVSPFHCSLLRTPMGLWVVDLLGPDGVCVNDALVRYTLLADNDVLKVGRYRIRVHCRFSDRSTLANSQPTTVALSQSLRRNPLDPVYTDGDSRLSNSRAIGPIPWQESSLGMLASLHSEHVSTVGWTTTTTNEPIQLAKGEISESVLVPLVNQFGMMQQQMLDQFQQAVAMLVQMFGTLHRDQMDTIREELDHLRNLTKEFQALKFELAARAQGQPPVMGRGSSMGPGNLKPQCVDTLSRDKKQENPGTEGGVNPVAARIGPVSGLATSALTSPSDLGNSPAKGMSRPLSFHVPLSTSSSQASPNSSGLGQPESGSTQATGRVSSLESDRDVMIWLHQRMMTLQQERESRWQKILKLLPGVS